MYLIILLGYTLFVYKELNMKMTLGRYINKRLEGVQGELPQLAYMFKK